MSDLKERLLVWHKLVCLVTGGLASTYVKQGLNRETALQWVTYLRDVADEIEAVLAGRPFILDSKGRRLVQSGAASRQDTHWPEQEAHHEVAKPTLSESSGKNATGRKAGGVRVATRKTT